MRWCHLIVLTSEICYNSFLLRERRSWSLILSDVSHVALFILIVIFQPEILKIFEKVVSLAVAKKKTFPVIPIREQPTAPGSCGPETGSTGCLS